MIIQRGKQSLEFESAPWIVSSASIVGKKEKEGPLGKYFDMHDEDARFGGDNWEEAESNMQNKAAEMAVEKTGLSMEDIRYIYAGDLLGQTIATSFGLMEYQRPLFGLYGACSTAGEALSLAAAGIESNMADFALAVTSSHFGGAEKQFRYPLEYANQRPLSATWTVTGSGAFVLASKEKAEKKRKEILRGEPVIDKDKILKPRAKITGITTGKIVDYGCRDSMNMGAAMAPAAAECIYANLKDFNRTPKDYDAIVTGDLGSIGQRILIDLLREKKVDIEKNHQDCGLLIFDQEKQDTHAGGSGCGCSATVLSAYLLHELEVHRLERILFVPTGALLSTVSYNEGKNVPGIAHAVVIESI